VAARDFFKRQAALSFCCFICRFFLPPFFLLLLFPVQPSSSLHSHPDWRISFFASNNTLPSLPLSLPSSLYLFRFLIVTGRGAAARATTTARRGTRTPTTVIAEATTATATAVVVCGGRVGGREGGRVRMHVETTNRCGCLRSERHYSKN